MPDKRAHRGPHPEDHHLFAPDQWDALRAAVSDFSWLLGRNYGEKSALKLVGDRFSLTERQRIAVMRCACSDEALARRRAHEADRDQIRDAPLRVDGYNVLTTIEAALSGGVLIQGRDGCLRDMASMHGSYRKVAETRPALELLGRYLGLWGVRNCLWYLDKPVSNSGRLKTIMNEVASEHGWSWQVELVPNPDAILRDTDEIVATADSVILDHCERWFNLTRTILQAEIPDLTIVQLGH